MTTILYPELKLAASALVLLLTGALAPKGRNPFRLVLALGVIVLLFLAGQEAFFDIWGAAFGGMFVSDAFSSYMKALVLAGAAAALLLAPGHAEREGIDKIEYPVLVLLSTLGMMLMISAGNLIVLYMGLELQSLPLYVLAALRRDSARSTEAGLKYFVLGALSSGLLLYGMSLVYGFSGTTDFGGIAAAVQGASSPGIVFGMVLTLVGLLFKISAVPFHMWAPDVYEGAPSPITAFFAIAPKAAAMALLARVLLVPFGAMAGQWQQIIILVSALSMGLGAVAAVVQTNIKRLLAYSSIGHMGYALIGLAAASGGGLKAVIVYMTIYAVMSAGAFAVVILSGKEKIAELAGLSKQRPWLALAMTLMMFSMAGIPPLAGFFGKLFIFQAAVDAHLYALAVFGVLTSVVAAYYYLRVIKVMYFDEAAGVFTTPCDRAANFVLIVSALAVVAFIAVPGPVVSGAGIAAYAVIR